jgi:CBS domain-containing protein
MVVDDGRLRGIIALRDLMRFFSLRIELGEDPDAAHEQMAQKEQKEQRPGSYQQQAPAER